MAKKFMTAGEKKQRNKEVYDNFMAQADTQVKEFVEMLMQFYVYREDKANGSVHIHVGQKIDDLCFQSRLTSYTKHPMVILDSWDDDPQVFIRNGDYEINNTICMLNLNAITNFTFKKEGTDNDYTGRANFTYCDDVDYQVTVCVHKEGNEGV